MKCSKIKNDVVYGGHLTETIRNGRKREDILIESAKKIITV